MLAVARTTTTLRRNAVITRVVVQQQTKRGMAGGHGPKPEWTGLDKTVRSYFPEDYQRTFVVVVKIPNSLLFTHRIQCIFMEYESVFAQHPFSRSLSPSSLMKLP